MSEPLPYNQLVSGRQYSISLRDCCVEAELIGMFISMTGEEDFEEFTFNIGVLRNIATSKLQFAEALLT